MTTQSNAAAIDTGLHNSMEHGREMASSLREKASYLRDRASELFQEGIDRARANPYAAAAVVGGVAVTAAAAAYGGAKLSQRNAAKAHSRADAIDPASLPDAMPTASL